MPRRVTGAGAIRLPQLEEGLRAVWAWLSDGHPAMRSPVIEALDRGELVALDGGHVWSALHGLDPDEADHFRRSCGWRPGTPSAWLIVDATRWTYDPRTALLTPMPTDTKE